MRVRAVQRLSLTCGTPGANVPFMKTYVDNSSLFKLAGKPAAARGLLAIALVFLLSGALLSCASVKGRPGFDEGRAAGEARGETTPAPAPVEPSLLPGDLLPIDPKVKVGVLQNGLTYYVRRNVTPEKRAELRLVVNAGSVLEDRDQLGLAHFLEHMAFEGTREFERQAIVDYLESIGMRYGPELNAYTSYDETVYMLQVPTDRSDALPTAVHILDEWAGAMTLDEGEIEKERGVVIEEWRLRRDAASRIRDAQMPVLLHGSKYADRAPIGVPEIIETFHPEVLRRFYRDWYRPDLMAVVAVGDFDPAEVEALIKEHFDGMRPPKNPRPRELNPVPDHRGTLVSIVTDKEASDSRITIYTKHPPVTVSTAGDYRDLLAESLFHGMLNERLDETAAGPGAPFLGAYSGNGRLVRAKEFFVLGAQVKDAEMERGFESLLTEAEKVRRFGFTEPELSRVKMKLLSSIESVYNEREKLESERFAGEYVGYFLEGEPIPGIEFERELYRTFLPGIALEEVNRLAAKWLVEDNRVVLASGPEDAALPSEEGLRGILSAVAGQDLEPYREDLADVPLMPAPPKPGRVRSERRFEQLSIVEWTLSNGAKVVLKPTDFKNDQVLFGAYSPGGHSLAPDAAHVAARTAADVVIEGGLGSFSKTDLAKKLAGKVVEAAPWIDELYEGMDGSSTPADLETLFQLIHLYFTSPRKDQGAFTAYREKARAQLENREASPEASFWDSVEEVLSGGNPRATPLKSGMLGEMDLDASFDFYRDRFSDAGDFTFFFVGAFDLAGIKPYVETYLASLPSSGRREGWRDLGVRIPAGVVKSTLRKGIEPKSRSVVVWGGAFDWSLKNVFTLNALANVLDIPLRENLREEEGGTYDVFAASGPSRYPAPEFRLYVGFGTAPDEVERLTDLAFDVVRGIRENGPAQADVEKVREILRRERETNLRRNEFWRSILRSYSMNGLEFRDILRYETFLEGLSVQSMREAAAAFLDPQRYVQVSLYPEGWGLLGKARVGGEQLEGIRPKSTIRTKS